MSNPQDPPPITTPPVSEGGLPASAIQRLNEQASRFGTDREFFTSDLSAGELMLTHECGFEPLGQVMGSTVYAVGWQGLGAGYAYIGSSELTVLSMAHMEARRLAFDRLRQEAKILRADGVVGVRFERQGGAFDGGMIEYIAIGTAVRRTNAPPAIHEPFVSNLSGQDHWTLRQSGYKPVGFAFGNCTWCEYPTWNTQWSTGSWQNIEVAQLTQGVYNARALAQQRMDNEAKLVHAEGIVGVTIDTHIERLDGGNNSYWYLMTFTAFGTAIARDTDATPLPDIPFMISLQDR